MSFVIHTFPLDVACCITPTGMTILNAWWAVDDNYPYATQPSTIQLALRKMSAVRNIYVPDVFTYDRLQRIVPYMDWPDSPPQIIIIGLPPDQCPMCRVWHCRRHAAVRLMRKKVVKFQPEIPHNQTFPSPLHAVEEEEEEDEEEEEEEEQQQGNSWTTPFDSSWTTPLWTPEQPQQQQPPQQQQHRPQLDEHRMMARFLEKMFTRTPAANSTPQKPADAEPQHPAPPQRKDARRAKADKRPQSPATTVAAGFEPHSPIGPPPPLTPPNSYQPISTPQAPKKVPKRKIRCTDVPKLDETILIDESP